MKRLGSTTSVRAREMRGVLNEWERSGLTLTEFARRRDVRPSTLSWWRYVFRQAGERSAEPRKAVRSKGIARREHRAPGSFIEVKVGGSGSGPAAPLLEVVLPSGYVIRVPREFDPVALRALTAALTFPC